MYFIYYGTKGAFINIQGKNVIILQGKIFEHFRIFKCKIREKGTDNLNCLQLQDEDWRGQQNNSFLLKNIGIQYNREKYLYYL